VRGATPTARRSSCIRLRAEAAFAAQPERRSKLDHYWRSLTMLEQTLGGHPLVNQLRFELEAIRDLPPRTKRGC
jgi:hypothetical protein